MKTQEAFEFAQQLLDSEFAEANDNPKGYCEAMGWKSNSKATKQAIKKQDSLCPNIEDYQKLTKIIEEIDSEDYSIIAESNSVQDFLVNCVASHIKSK